MSEVHVHVERVVVDGVAVADRARYQAEVEAALADALQARGLAPGLAGGGAFAFVPAPRAAVHDGASVGAAVAEGLAG